MNKDDLDGAADYFCRSLDVNQDNISACKSLLEVSYKLEKFEKIEIYLDKYMEIHPANVNMRFAVAGVQYKLGKLEDAIKNLECILVLDPVHESALKMIESVRSDLVFSK
jgi:tetratricopeptide (TPR) repeat protein